VPRFLHYAIDNLRVVKRNPQGAVMIGQEPVGAIQSPEGELVEA
jgi:hypothetical protein